MNEIKTAAAALPSGKFFEQLFAGALTSWAGRHGLAIFRVDLGAASAGTICNAVESVDILLADVSGHDPRVLYLAGYAQGIGKRVQFITQVEDDFPFRSGNQAAIVYSGNEDLLLSGLDRLFAPPQDNADPAAGPMDRFYEMFGEILRAHGHKHRGAIEMENPQTYVLHDQDMDLPLVQALSRHAREIGVRLKLM